MKTTLFNKKDIKRKYYLMDAEGAVLGRLSTEVALILSGKRKTEYTPNVDNGDFVVVINAEKVTVTGTKGEDKLYKRYSGYPGGLKSKNFDTLIKTKPTEVIRHAVKGMLPKNKLGSRMITRLKLYSGAKHPHEAQCPEKIEIRKQPKGWVPV
jgi:large subunit ribosomal protein L13